jgi:hypothetical protein
MIICAAKCASGEFGVRNHFVKVEKVETNEEVVKYNISKISKKHFNFFSKSEKRKELKFKK